MTFVIANWKMNFGLNDAVDFCAAMSLVARDKADSKKQFIIAPPALYLSHLAKFFPELMFSAQNISEYSEAYGSYTGDISVAMLQSCGIKYSIIGHSERRLYYGENYEQSRVKIEHCISSDVIPIVCIGENIEVRRNNRYIEDIKEQLIEVLPSRLSNSQYIIAYEPLWSIGSGITPSSAELNEVYELVNVITMSIAQPIAIVYGGSVNSTNVAPILKSTKYNGVLLGRASLDREELIKVMDIVYD